MHPASPTHPVLPLIFPLNKQHCADMGVVSPAAVQRFFMDPDPFLMELTPQSGTPRPEPTHHSLGPALTVMESSLPWPLSAAPQVTIPCLCIAAFSLHLPGPP